VGNAGLGAPIELEFVGDPERESSLRANGLIRPVLVVRCSEDDILSILRSLQRKRADKIFIPHHAPRALFVFQYIEFEAVDSTTNVG